MKKTLISIALIVLLSLTTILVDFFQFSWELIFTPKYWIETLSVQVPIVVIILCMRDIAIDDEKRKNNDYIDATGRILNAYKVIHSGKEKLQAFVEYIRTDNHARKQQAYEQKLDRKTFKKTTKKKKIELALQGRKERLSLRAEKRTLMSGKVVDPIEHNPLWLIRVLWANKRLERLTAKISVLESRRAKADKLVDFIRVRYSKVSYSNLFTDSTVKQSDAYDLAIHNGKDIGLLLLSKVLWIVAIGIIVSSFVAFSVDGEPFAIIYNVISRAMQIALAIYTGMSVGQEFVRNEILLRLKLRITYLQAFLYSI